MSLPLAAYLCAGQQRILVCAARIAAFRVHLLLELLVARISSEHGVPAYCPQAAKEPPARTVCCGSVRASPDI
jgi:hypothetical protein